MEAPESLDTVEALESVARDLAWLTPRPFFFGAAVLHFYLDDPAMAGEARPTSDIDILVTSPYSGSEYGSTARFEEELRGRGWRHDTRPNRRNIHAFMSPSAVPVDVVFGTGGTTPGGSQSEQGLVVDWPQVAARSPASRELPSGRMVHLPSPGFFLACKIAASRNPERWDGDYSSKDLEDIALLFAGCESLIESVIEGPAELRGTVSDWARELCSRSTPYGRLGADLLLANVPRGSSVRAVGDRLVGLSGPSVLRPAS